MTFSNVHFHAHHGYDHDLGHSHSRSHYRHELGTADIDRRSQREEAPFAHANPQSSYTYYSIASAFPRHEFLLVMAVGSIAHDHDRSGSAEEICVPTGQVGACPETLSENLIVVHWNYGWSWLVRLIRAV